MLIEHLDATHPPDPLTIVKLVVLNRRCVLFYGVAYLRSPSGFVITCADASPRQAAVASGCISLTG
jgi:hypothetical protein